jgi:hypothetical protein
MHADSSTEVSGTIAAVLAAAADGLHDPRDGQGGGINAHDLNDALAPLREELRANRLSSGRCPQPPRAGFPAGLGLAADDGLRNERFRQARNTPRRKAHERYLEERELQRLLAEKDTAETVRDAATTWNVAGQTLGPNSGPQPRTRGSPTT